MAKALAVARLPAHTPRAGALAVFASPQPGPSPSHGYSGMNPERRTLRWPSGGWQAQTRWRRGVRRQPQLLHHPCPVRGHLGKRRPYEGCYSKHGHQWLALEHLAAVAVAKLLSPSVAIGRQPATLNDPDPSRRETRARARSPVWWPPGRSPAPTAHQRVWDLLRPSLPFASSAIQDTVTSRCKIACHKIVSETSCVSASSKGVPMENCKDQLKSLPILSGELCIVVTKNGS